VLLEFTFKFIKEFLGIKDMYVVILPITTEVYKTTNSFLRNTFPLLKIIYNETLIFSLYVFLLSILFYN
ncbi:hypothetical protein GQ44DRAFT_626895, partial [Phaeosphaeriaceae sp. PMI808]